jgi:hypothetical protein
MFPARTSRSKIFIECAKCHKALGKTLVVTFYRLLDAAPDRLQELVKTLLQEFPTVCPISYASIHKNTDDDAIARCTTLRMLFHLARYRSVFQP